MSTFSFSADLGNPESISKIRYHLQKLVNDNSIENWHINTNDGTQVLQVETNKLSPEELKHLIRAAGFDVNFTVAPQVK